ncbi:MAG: hypothetical protein IK099_07795 [Clostridia bacterium]|nr:hypothetical protein [Clostridia bacterium]
MAEGLILQVPAALVCYGLALFFNLFDRRFRASRGVMTYLSALLAVAGTAVALLRGVSLREAAALLLIFLLLNLGVKE